ncbi:hypothetical protein [Aurantiacibacter gilvus]|uniref:J domain-containing protein n=1 Tax=Aurantiacibacter gilvus TaxID=3139141 RepID=A0ABU9IFB4_9SPHN
MTARFPWGALGIEPTNDRKAIRSAYAAKLKAINPDEDVAGFTRLRQAREEALWLAKEGRAEEGGFEAEDFFGDAQILGAVDLNEVTSSDAGPAAPVPPLDDTDAGVREPHDPKPGRFLEILFPGGEFTEDPLTAEEYEEAAGLMQAIFADAQGAVIDKQGGIEDWLAHYLASGWPRTGPLVEDAVAAFGWDRDAGRIDEYAPVAFLNARLHALTFLKELEQPDHEWHHAYVELRKPGPRSKLPWQGANIKHVTDLLVYMRENYPELEAYLDGERVASYVEPDEVGSPWKWALLVVIGLVFLFRIGAAISDSSPQATYSAPPIVTSQAIPAGWSEAQQQEVIDVLFGPAVDLSTVQIQAPAFAEELMRLEDMGLSADNALSLARSDLRRRVLQAAANAEFGDLVSIKQHELNLIRWLRDNEGVEACAAPGIWYGGQDAFEGDAELTVEGRDLARQVLMARLLQDDPPDFPLRASIPGNVVQEVMDRAGLSQAQFDQAAQNQGDAATRCAYRVALLETILRRPGTVSADLLRIG